MWEVASITCQNLSSRNRNQIFLPVASSSSLQLTHRIFALFYSFAFSQFSQLSYFPFTEWKNQSFVSGCHPNFPWCQFRCELTVCRERRGCGIRHPVLIDTWWDRSSGNPCEEWQIRLHNPSWPDRWTSFWTGSTARRHSFWDGKTSSRFWFVVLCCCVFCFHQHHHVHQDQVYVFVKRYVQAFAHCVIIPFMSGERTPLCLWDEEREFRYRRVVWIRFFMMIHSDEKHGRWEEERRERRERRYNDEQK